MSRDGMRGAVVLLEVARVARLMREYGDRFLDRVFTEEEREKCLGRRDAAERLAARFAAKQAAHRLLEGRRFPWRDASVVGGDSEVPFLRLATPVQGRAHLSLSHDGGVAAAAVIIEEGSGL